MKAVIFIEKIYASDIVKIAEGEIGVTESPKNSNKQKYGKAYGVDGTAWCCQFVWWVFNKANASKLFYDGKKTAWVPTVRKYYTSIGKWIPRGSGNPKSGDLIIFGRKETADSGTHIGIVTKISGGKVYTVEGNTSAKTGVDSNGGSVAQKSYLLSYSSIAGYCSINYDVKESAESEVKTVTVKLREIANGSKGNDVKSAQVLLNGYGYNCGKADGIFGTNTTAATKKYQKAKNIKDDGIIGATTWNKLLNGV